MSFRKNLKKYTLIVFILLGALALAVLATFKGGKVIGYFTPEKPVQMSELETPSLQKVKIYKTDSAEPQGLVIIAADKASFQQQEALANALARQDIIAVVFDFDVFRKQMAAEPDDEDCFYVPDDLKDAGEAVQRKLQLKRYFFPVIVGLGDAAPFAYAAVAQAPDNTLAGAISVGFSSVLKTDRPYCDGVTKTSASLQDTSPLERTFLISNDQKLPAQWYVVTKASDQAKVEEFQNSLDKAVSITAEDEKTTINSVIALAKELQHQEQKGIQSLPISLIKPVGEAKALIVIFSGDGGWRDIDKTIGDNLAAKGIAVVGVDTLRYFWTRKEPATIASDIELMLNTYGKEFKTDTYALAGYSFGANVIPLAWPLLDKSLRKKVKLVSLLGLSPEADLEISVEGYLGSSSDTSEDVRPMLSRLPLDRTQCFYGVEEVEDKETACILPELDTAERIKTEGGHHFDGNYDALADKIAQRLLN